MGDEKNKVFEDEFMDIQSEIISLCMDYVDKNADIIYAYCAIEERMQSFNACFRCGNELKRVEDFDKSRPEKMKFLRDGSSRLFDIREVCANYNLPVPTQIKMIYDVNTGKFKADYKYEKVCTDISADEVYDEWVEELKNQLMTVQS